MRRVLTLVPFVLAIVNLVGCSQQPAPTPIKPFLSGVLGDLDGYCRPNVPAKDQNGISQYLYADTLGKAELSDARPELKTSLIKSGFTYEHGFSKDGKIGENWVAARPDKNLSCVSITIEGPAAENMEIVKVSLGDKVGVYDGVWCDILPGSTADAQALLYVLAVYVGRAKFDTDIPPANENGLHTAKQPIYNFNTVIGTAMCTIGK